MNAIALLIGLLVLAYVGGFLVGGRALRGAGLPSGSEFVLAGFVIGPLALGLASVSTLSLFVPLTEVAIAWIALVRGLEFGPFGERALKKRWVFFASLLAVFTALVVAAAAYLALGALGLLEPRERMLAAAGLGAAAGESPRLVVRWVVERLGASGPLTDLLGDLAEGDQLAPLTLVAAVFSFEVQSALPVSLPPFGWFAITVLLGVLLGGIAALLLGRRFDPNEAWGVLLGTGLVAMGLSVRVGLAPLTTAFFLGLGLAAFSPHREALQAMVRRTERPVLLPALLLAGARVALDLPITFLPVIGVAVAARVATKLTTGAAIASLTPSDRVSWLTLGAGLSSAGPLALSIGLAFSLRFPGATGAVVLTGAAVMALVGEFIGPAALQRALRAAGEISSRSSLPEPALAEVDP